MKLRLSTDLLTALLFLGLGLFTILYSLQYPLGTANRMGAGYFPRLIAIGLLVIGGILAIRALTSEGERFGAFAFRPLFFVLAGTLAFGLLIEKGGLLIAGTALVILTRLGSNEFRIVEVLVLAAVLIIVSAGLFTYALGLPIPVFPRW